MSERKEVLKFMMESGVHLGHIAQKWNPKMKPYIFMKRNNTHIIDLRKTLAELERAKAVLKQMALAGHKIMFVSTKKQARKSIIEYAESVDMPYIVERWPGGLLTNFITIRNSIRKMKRIDGMKGDNKIYGTLSKREKLQLERENLKLEKIFGSISQLNRTPSALILVDVIRESIAIKEAMTMNIPVFALVDTNSNPTLVKYPIPANDDSASSIDFILKSLTDSIHSGLSERAQKREMQKEKTSGTKESGSTETQNQSEK